MKQTSFIIFLLCVIIGSSCKMSNDKDFAVIYGVTSVNSVEELRSFDWDEIVMQINAGEFNEKINWVMTTQEIPNHYNKKS